MILNAEIVQLDKEVETMNRETDACRIKILLKAHKILTSSSGQDARIESKLSEFHIITS